jgi:hypothetical protein
MSNEMSELVGPPLETGSQYTIHAFNLNLIDRHKWIETQRPDVKVCYDGKRFLVAIRSEP